MQISYIEAVKKQGEAMPLDFEFEPALYILEDRNASFIGPVKVTGYYKFNYGRLELSLSLNFSLSFKCDSCFVDSKEDFSLELYEEFSKTPTNEQFLCDDVVEIDEILNSTINFGLPIALYCQEDCKGLCQQCGQNLNLKNCVCETEDPNNPFSLIQDKLLNPTSNRGGAKDGSTQEKNFKTKR